MEDPPGTLAEVSPMKELKHNKIYLLLIRETGKVRSRNISFRFVRWVLLAFLILFAITSFFTYLYFSGLHQAGTEKQEVALLLKEIDRFRAKIDEQELEINRLTGQLERLQKGGKRSAGQKKKGSKLPLPKGVTRTPSLNLKAAADFDAFLGVLENLKAKKSGIFHIRDPQIVVSKTATAITFKLYKDNFKMVRGRYVILGIRKNEDKAGKSGKVVAYPAKSLVRLTLRPFLGKLFKIKRRFLTITAKLFHPKGLERFTEIHVLLFGFKREVLFHEQFKAP